MIIRINGAPVPADGPSVMDRINGFADWFIESETQILAKPAEHTFMALAERFFDVVNACSAEIITLGIVACAIGMMVGPLTGGGGSKWMGRLFVTFWGGLIWRMVT